MEYQSGGGEEAGGAHVDLAGGACRPIEVHSCHQCLYFRYWYSSPDCVIDISQSHCYSLIAK